MSLRPFALLPAIALLIAAAPAEAAPTLRLLPELAKASEAPSVVTAPAESPSRLSIDTKLFLAGAGGAVVGVPLALFSGHQLGKVPNGLVPTLLAGVLPLLVLPPLAVTLSEWLVGRQVSPGGVRFLPAFFVTLGVQLLAIGAGVATDTSASEIGSAALFTVGEAVALPAAATLTMDLAGPPAAAPASAPARNAVRGSTVNVPVFAAAF